VIGKVVLSHEEWVVVETTYPKNFNKTSCGKKVDGLIVDNYESCIKFQQLESLLMTHEKRYK